MRNDSKARITGSKKSKKRLGPDDNGVAASDRLGLGFNMASELSGLSVGFLRNAANDPDPQRRLRTVRISTRRLIRPSDLDDWFKRVSRLDTDAVNNSTAA